MWKERGAATSTRLQELLYPWKCRLRSGDASSLSEAELPTLQNLCRGKLRNEFRAGRLNGKDFPNPGGRIGFPAEQSFLSP